MLRQHLGTLTPGGSHTCITCAAHCKEIIELEREIQVQKGIVEFVFIPVRHMRERAERAEARLEQALVEQVSGFYEEEVPIFRQGAPHHELESLVTVADCSAWIEKIVKLEAALTDIHSCASNEMSGGCYHCKRTAAKALGI
jgi:hypothetical protein